MRGLVIGRFQPFHEGHRYLIDQIADDVDEVVVGVGSAGQSHTAENPYTSGERVQMIANTLESLETRAYVIPIRDIERNAMWVSHIATLCPSFDLVYTNNPFVERLFAESNYDVRVQGTPLHRREIYWGREIRRRMVADEEWRPRVPGAVEDVIDEIDGVARLKAVTEDDEPADEPSPSDAEPDDE